MTSSPGAELRISPHGTDLWFELGDLALVQSKEPAEKGTIRSYHRMTIAGTEVHLASYVAMFVRLERGAPIVRQYSEDFSYHPILRLYDLFAMAKGGKPNWFPGKTYRFLYHAGVLGQAMSSKENGTLLWPLMPVVKGVNFDRFEEIVRKVPSRDAKGHWSHY